MATCKRFLMDRSSVLKYFLLIILIYACICVVIYNNDSNNNNNNEPLNAIYPDIVNHSAIKFEKCREDLKNALLLKDAFKTKNGGHVSIETILSAKFTYHMYCTDRQRHNMTLAPYADKYGIKLLLPKLSPTLKFSRTFAHVDSCSDITQKLLDRLPENYIMKASHLSGGIVRVKGAEVTCIKNPYLDRDEGESKLSYMRRLCAKFMQRNYWEKKTGDGEQYYKYVPKRIIFEEDFESWGQITEYRVWIINQEPAYVIINSNRKIAAYGYDVNMRTLDWEEVWGINVKEDLIYQCMTRVQLPVDPPPFFPKILAHARNIGKLFVLARLDFFVFNNNEYRFSEVTMCSGNCKLMYEPPVMDYLLGYSLLHPEAGLDLPNIVKKFV